MTKSSKIGASLIQPYYYFSQEKFFISEQLIEDREQQLRACKQIRKMFSLFKAAKPVVKIA